MAHPEPRVALEAWSVLIASFHGRAVQVQDALVTHWKATKDSTFFIATKEHLRRAVNDLREQKQHMMKMKERRSAMRVTKDETGSQASTATTGTDGSMDSNAGGGVSEAEDVDSFTEAGHILEVLTCLRWMGAGPHKRMQNYMRHQEGHEHTQDLLSELVNNYLSSLELEIGDSISAGSRKTMQVATKVFTTLRTLARGPNYGAFSVLMSSKLFESINRLFVKLQYDGWMDGPKWQVQTRKPPAS